MGGGSSAAKQAKETSSNSAATTDDTTGKKGQPTDDKMSKPDPKKDKQTAKPNTKTTEPERADKKREDDDDKDGSRGREGRNDDNAKDRPRNDRRRRRNRSGDDDDDENYTDDDDDKDDRKRKGNERRSRENTDKNSADRNRRNATSRDRDEHSPKPDERKTYLKDLEKIAENLFRKPPDPVHDSKTYTSAVDTFDDRLRVATNERELKALYDREVQLLQNQTAEDHLRAKHATHGEVTRQTQESEYRLKLSALINCFKAKNRFYELLTLQREQEKREDMSFLLNLHDQIKKNDLSREDVLRQMDEYHRHCRSQAPRDKGRPDRNPAATSDQRHQTRVDDPSDRYTTRPAAGGQGGVQPVNGGSGSGYPLPAGAKLRVKDEAERVMADSERSTQRAVDIRKADRSRINREINSRASSVNSSSLPPR